MGREKSPWCCSSGLLRLVRANRPETCTTDVQINTFVHIDRWACEHQTLVITTGPKTHTAYKAPKIESRLISHDALLCTQRLKLKPFTVDLVAGGVLATRKHETRHSCCRQAEYGIRREDITTARAVHALYYPALVQRKKYLIGCIEQHAYGVVEGGGDRTKPPAADRPDKIALAPRRTPRWVTQPKAGCQSI